MYPSASTTSRQPRRSTTLPSSRSATRVSAPQKARSATGRTASRSGSAPARVRCRPTRNPGCISASRPLRARASTPFTRQRSRTAAATTASRGCAPITAQTTTRRSLSIPTAIGSRPIVVRLSEMASIRKEIFTSAQPDDVWDALRDIGALHTRLVPGFVTDTRLEPGARIVTFGNGMVARELIVTIDDDQRRVVWSVVGGSLTHHNGSAQVFSDAKGLAKVVWIADLLPDEAAGAIGAMMEQGMTVMKQTLDHLADEITKAK